MFQIPSRLHQPQQQRNTITAYSSNNNNVRSDAHIQTVPIPWLNLTTATMTTRRNSAMLATVNNNNNDRSNSTTVKNITPPTRLRCFLNAKSTLKHAANDVVPYAEKSPR
jgi:hypothetical protein